MPCVSRPVQSVTVTALPAFHPRRVLQRRFHQRHARGLDANPDARDKLGAGRYAQVQRAWDNQGNTVAVKTHPRWMPVPDESKLLMALRLPHVIRALAASEDDGHRYLVLEHGRPVRIDATMTPARARRIMHDVLAGLRELQALGIYHRDVAVETEGGKVEIHNVMKVGNTYKLIDLNLAAVRPAEALRPVCARADGRGAAEVLRALLQACEPDEVSRFDAWCATQRGPLIEDLARYPWLGPRPHTEPLAAAVHPAVQAWDRLTEKATLPLWVLNPN